PLERRFVERVEDRRAVLAAVVEHALHVRGRAARGGGRGRTRRLLVAAPSTAPAPLLLGPCVRAVAGRSGRGRRRRVVRGRGHGGRQERPGVRLLGECRIRCGRGLGSFEQAGVLLGLGEDVVVGVAAVGGGVGPVVRQQLVVVVVVF